MNITRTKTSPNTTFSRFSLLCKPCPTYLRYKHANQYASGGLLLLVNMGPGSFSVDEKKKVY